MDRQDARREDGTTVLDKTEVVSGDGGNGGDGSKKGAWSEFSFASVIASALASVTSVLLMSRIGIGGSLIGVGVAAGASALASQVYKGVLSSSAEKLKSAAGQQANEGGAPWAASRDAKQDAAARPDGQAAEDATKLMPRPVTISDKTGPHAKAASGTPIAPEAIRNAAAERQSRVARRRITVVCIVAALAAVALTAVIISVATQGTGLGPTYSAPAQTTATEQPATTGEGSGGQQQAKPTEQDSSKPDEKKDQAATNEKDPSSSSSSSTGATSDSGPTSGATGATTSNSGSGSASSDSNTTSTKTEGSNSSSGSNGGSTSSSTDGKKDSSSTSSSSTSGTTTSKTDSAASTTASGSNG